MIFRRNRISGSTVPRHGGRSRFRRAARRIFTTLIVLMVAGFLGGFVIFVERVSSITPPAAPNADAIVALTGGAQRITDAVELLANGSAKRLLISGVNEQITEDQLKKAVPSSAPFFKCCIDIGYSARNTRGNATESRDWAVDNGFHSLIVVTSAYHMPRSMAELKHVMPDIELIAYPVHQDDLDLAGWTENFGTFRLLMIEYIKFLVARLG